MSMSLRTADEATVRMLDGVVIFWVTLWLLVGAWSGITMWQVSAVGDTISNSGRALESAGEALTTVGRLPVVGASADQLGSDVTAASADITGRGQVIKSRLRQLSLLLGLSIVLIPTTPVVGLYLPLRMTRRREKKQLRDVLRTYGRDAGLDRQLAEQALRTLPYLTVREISEDAWADVAMGDTRALADIELRRLGLRPDGVE